MTWRSSLKKRLHERGFDNLSGLLTSRPGVGCVQLAAELGPPVLGVDIARGLLTEAQERGKVAFREAARELLARHLREILVNGWGQARPDDEPDTDSQIINLSAWGLWSLEVTNMDESLNDKAHAVFRALEANATPGWRPADANDPILIRSFDLGWPQETT